MARWHSCNVFQTGSQVQNLWQFSSRFNLQKADAKLPNDPLPAKVIAKDWQTLFQPKLNIAWLPADKVFLRAIQLPKADAAETRSMVEFQLEKLSPLPVAQIVWGFELLPESAGQMQTAVVIVVARSHVEEFLGQLEGRGYLADRLELPFLDQLGATQVNHDGVWIYPGSGSDKNSCLAAWWSRETLQHLTMVHLPANDSRSAALQEQLTQTIWAGELEGWLSAAPRFHLVAENDAVSDWRTLFTPEQAVSVVSPVPAPQLAALTCKRVAAEGPPTNLLPPEYSARYRQRFIDRLWMRLLGTVLMLYLLGVATYFGLTYAANWKLEAVQREVVSLGTAYTNTLQIKERVKVLQDQLDLQYAALDCYKAVAEKLPEELTLDTLNFERGRKVGLFGTAPGEQVSKVQEFNDLLRNVTIKDQPLFSKVTAPSIISRAGMQQSTWSFTCDLKRGEGE